MVSAFGCAHSKLGRTAVLVGWVIPGGAIPRRSELFSDPGYPGASNILSNWITWAARIILEGRTILTGWIGPVGWVIQEGYAILVRMGGLNYLGGLGNISGLAALYLGFSYQCFCLY